MSKQHVKFDMSKQLQATCSIRYSTCRMLQVACCFDMLLVWTGLQAYSRIGKHLCFRSISISERWIKKTKTTYRAYFYDKCYINYITSLQRRTINSKLRQYQYPFSNITEKVSRINQSINQSQSIDLYCITKTYSDTMGTSKAR